LLKALTAQKITVVSNILTVLMVVDDKVSGRTTLLKHYPLLSGPKSKQLRTGRRQEFRAGIHR
jgi:hypothetical protein